MTGGTLIVSRNINLLPHYKKRLEDFGYKNVSYTSAEKDGLNMIINELKPKTIIMQAGFYKSVTPYMIAFLIKQFKKINFTAVSMGDYPADLAMMFIINGAKSFVNYLDGREQFFRGLDYIRDEKNFISPSVQERFDLRQELPKAARELTDRQIEIIRLVCNGFTDDEIGDCLHISSRTVDAHKRDIYLALNVRNGCELFRAALLLEIIKKEELIFFGRNFSLKPRINKNGRRYKRKEKREE